ncbi:MAG: SCO family protein [Bacteroidia bacterium]|nr:SCO family protein [Bacteroidia bacterium]
MKKKYGYIGLGIIVLIFGILVIPEIYDRLREDQVVDTNRMHTPDLNAKLAYVTLNGEKRHLPAFNFLNQDSLLISNEDFLGKVSIVEFFFTTCPTICPIMNKNLVDIQNEFEDKEDLAFASFTINPEYDTPFVLKQYAEEYGITDLDWHLLTGDREAIYDLANAGFNIYVAEMQDVPGGFEHSGLFALIDREGYIRSRRDSYGNPIVYYRGTITQAQGTNSEGMEEQISLLKEDISKLLQE